MNSFNRLSSNTVSNTVIPIAGNNTTGLTNEIDRNGIQGWYMNGKQLTLPNTTELREAVAYASQSKRSRDSIGYDIVENCNSSRSRCHGSRAFSSPRGSNSLTSNLVSEVSDIIKPFDYSTGYSDFLEYYLDRLPLLENSKLDYSSDYPNLESVDPHDWNREYTNLLYYQQFNSANQDNDIECWMSLRYQKPLTLIVIHTKVQIDFSSLIAVLTVATSATGYMEI